MGCENENVVLKEKGVLFENVMYACIIPKGQMHMGCVCETFSFLWGNLNYPIWVMWVIFCLSYTFPFLSCYLFTIPLFGFCFPSNLVLAYRSYCSKGVDDVNFNLLFNLFCNCVE